MVYTKCLVFLAFCGGCLKCSLLGPKWDVGGEMVTGGKRSSVNPWQKARRSTEPFTVCPPWWQLLMGWTPSGVSAGVARSCWGSPPGQGRWVLGRGTGLRSGGAVGTSGLVKPLHSFHLWNNPKSQTLSSLGTGWTSVTFVPLVIMHEPSNALGLFCKNLLVKPLSSRDLILLG